jgi:hypothetical protein
MRITAILFTASGVCISVATGLLSGVAAGLFVAGCFFFLAAYVAILVANA